ncbi:1-acyl-sn-glycerol-3-phosphate acyltransferase [Acetobacteraceae bacterium]|nr:1-acyl-sn-glycerol-3-phosphate acyltransferase [Acetobacteraceae bacterium]
MQGEETLKHGDSMGIFQNMLKFGKNKKGSDSTVRSRSGGKFVRPIVDPEKFFHSSPGLRVKSPFNPIRAVCKLILVLIWGTLCCLLQAVLWKLPGSLCIRFPKFFWTGICRIMGIQVRQIGRPIGSANIGRFRDSSKQSVLFVANHTSWLDIIVTGQGLYTIFAAKKEIRNWPLVGILTYLGGTIYISREKQGTQQEVRKMLEKLKDGYNITLFPEGTTSSGVSLRPFLSTLFSLAKPKLYGKEFSKEMPTPLIQPISIVYDQLEGLPIGRNRRTGVFSWFGDMDFAPHLWEIAQWKSLRATILFHPPLDPNEFASRKAMSVAAHEIIRHGAEALRQDRPFLDEDVNKIKALHEKT